MQNRKADCKNQKSHQKENMENNCTQKDTNQTSFRWKKSDGRDVANSHLYNRIYHMVKQEEMVGFWIGK